MHSTLDIIAASISAMVLTSISLLIIYKEVINFREKSKRRKCRLKFIGSDGELLIDDLHNTSLYEARKLAKDKAKWLNELDYPITWNYEVT
jgi:hypothetical protein